MSAPASVYPVHRPTEVGSQLTFCLDNVALQLSIQLFPCNDSAARPSLPSLCLFLLSVHVLDLDAFGKRKIKQTEMSYCSKKSMDTPK